MIYKKIVIRRLLAKALKNAYRAGVELHGRGWTDAEKIRITEAIERLEELRELNEESSRRSP